ncbi:MAG: WD40 repeat domain-containing protein, partial [Microcystis panniformis]
VLSLRFSPDKNGLISGDSKGNLIFWNIKKGQPLTPKILTETDLGKIYSIEFNPIQKQILAFAGSLGIINFWDMNANKSLDPIIAQVGDIYALKYSPDGKILASGGDTIRLWNSITHEQIALLNGHISGINSLQFSPNGKVLASASGDGEIKLWDMSNQQLLATLKGHYKKINDIEFVGQDGSIL